MNKYFIDPIRNFSVNFPVSSNRKQLQCRISEGFNKRQGLNPVWGRITTLILGQPAQRKGVK